MPDRLVANHTDAYLPPLAVVNRLKDEFAYVETDGEEGRRYVLATIERLTAERSLRQADRDLVQWLERVKNRALFVCFGDNAGSDLALLSTYVIPATPLPFDYASVTHERAVQPLLARCAAALGYEIRKDRRVSSQADYRGRERRHSGRERRRFIERRSFTDRRKSAGAPHVARLS
jgi:hypothetical protein